MNMAIWDFRPRGDVLTGVAVGVSALAAPVVVPLVWSAVRPLVKAIFKGGFVLYETGRGAIAEASEWVGSEEPKTVTPAKVVKAEKHIVAAVPEKDTKRQKEQLLEQRAEHVGKIEAKESPKKAAHAKPKRQAKTTKKKPEEEK
jgi:hypothetical protein